MVEHKKEKKKKNGVEAPRTEWPFDLPLAAC